MLIGLLFLTVFIASSMAMPQRYADLEAREMNEFKNAFLQYLMRSMMSGKYCRYTHGYRAMWPILHNLICTTQLTLHSLHSKACMHGGYNEVLQEARNLNPTSSNLSIRMV